MQHDGTEWEKSKGYVKYVAYYNTIKDKLPVEYTENFNLHDCRILSVHQDKNKLILDINSSGGFISATQVIFIGCTHNTMVKTIGAIWLIDEIYINDDVSYTLMVLAGKNHRKIIEAKLTCKEFQIN